MKEGSRTCSATTTKQRSERRLYQEFNHGRELNSWSLRWWEAASLLVPLVGTVFPCLGSSRVQWGHTYSSWFEWRLHLLVLQFLPVHVAEEAVLPDVSLPLRTTAQSLRWMLRHQLDGQRDIRELLRVPQSNLSCLMAHVLCPFSPTLYSHICSSLWITVTVFFKYITITSLCSLPLPFQYDLHLSFLIRKLIFIHVSFLTVSIFEQDHECEAVLAALRGTAVHLAKC